MTNNDPGDELRRMEAQKRQMMIERSVDADERGRISTSLSAASDGLLAAFMSLNHLAMMTNHPESPEYARAVVYCQLCAGEVNARLNAALKRATENAPSPLTLLGPLGKGR